MKTIFSSLVLIYFISGLTVFAQEIEMDEIPTPVGGITAIVQNVTYPQSAKENKLEGKVIIKAIIDEKGNVSSTEVVQSLSKEYDNAAALAIKKTKFTPGIKDGKKVSAEITIPIMFKLSDKKS